MIVDVEATMTQSTVHNPTNFDPADYEGLDYLDNKRPEYFGGDIEAWKDEIKWWEAELERALGPDWRRKSHRCVHCGNGHIRWITVTRHLPTDETVVFGADCTKRLEFVDKVTFKLAQLQSRDAARKVRIKVWNDRQRYLDAHPEIAEALKAIEEPVHAGNGFVKDVLSKLDTYGYLTERQAAAVVSSLAKDHEFAARRAEQEAEVKGDAPSGRCEVTGVILSLKERETDFGVVTKALVKLANNSKVWFTANWDVERGDTITVRATFEVSRDDKSFAFGKRPHLVSRVPAASEVA